MKVTIKGQVTIPQYIRGKLGITASSEVDFLEEKDRVYLVKKTGKTPKHSAFRKLRGVATVRLTTAEIMSLTRKK